MEVPKLTIIIPLYNSVEFVTDCVNSVLSSLYDDQTEIIIVDDGSTDNGPSIARSLASSNSYIRVISQENQGLSGARNTGIEHANGKYIWFLDADDELTIQSSDVVEYLSIHDELDFLAVQLQKVDESRNLLSIDCAQPTLPKNVVMTGRDAILNDYNPSSACAIIMRRDFLNEKNLRFKIGITHEDVEFTFRAMSKAKKVMFTDLKPYLYFRRGNTMSTPHDHERLLKYIIDDVDVADSFRSLAKEYKSSDLKLYNKILLRSQSVVFGLVLQLYHNKKQWQEKGIDQVVMQRLKEKNFFPLRKPYYSWKQRLMSFWLNFILK